MEATTNARTETPRHEVVIIGGGFGGLGAAIALKRAGIDDFVILERADDIGGTWRENTYPDVASTTTTTNPRSPGTQTVPQARMLASSSSPNRCRAGRSARSSASPDRRPTRLRRSSGSRSRSYISYSVAALPFGSK